jgi:hypothetical protein
MRGRTALRAGALPALFARKASGSRHTPPVESEHFAGEFHASCYRNRFPDASAQCESKNVLPSTPPDRCDIPVLRTSRPVLRDVGQAGPTAVPSVARSVHLCPHISRCLSMRSTPVCASACPAVCCAIWAVIDPPRKGKRTAFGNPLILNHSPTTLRNATPPDSGGNLSEYATCPPALLSEPRGALVRLPK